MGVVYVEVDDDDGDSEYDRVGCNMPSSMWSKNKKEHAFLHLNGKYVCSQR